MLDKKHPFFSVFQRLAAEAASRSPVYDIGTSGRFVKEVGLVKELFDENHYFACGYQPSNLGQPEGCDFHCDIQDMVAVDDESVGSILCMEVLEHVERPRDAIREMLRILKPDGIAIVSVPFLISYHGKSDKLSHRDQQKQNLSASLASHDTYADYWRFTHEGLGLLFENAGFSEVKIFPVDGRFICRLQLLGVYHRLMRMPGFPRLARYLDNPQLGRATTMHFVRAQK